MNEVYDITINCSPRVKESIKRFRKDAIEDEDFDLVKVYDEQLALLDKGVVCVSNLQEYFDLLNKIDELWETDYYVCNCGTWIEIGE